MRVVVPSRPGGPETLEILQRDTPSPGVGQILIEVAYAGVNRHDCNQRSRGEPPKGATDVLGLEVSGIVAAIGSDAADWRIGQRICALTDGGGYADYVVADAALCFAVPEVLNLKEAASIPEALFTSWLNLMEIANLRPGESVLVHGGTSGVGVIALQLTRALRSRVFATAGSERKKSAAEKLGAELCVNYRDADFVDQILNATDGAGVDVILDMAGAHYAERNLRVLRRDGRIVHLSSAGPDYSPPLRLIMERRARISGSLLRPLDRDRKIEIAEILKERVWPMLGRSIKPVIDSIYPLEKVAEAHLRMESSMHIGKILLKTDLNATTRSA